MSDYVKPAKYSGMIMLLCCILLLVNTIFPINTLGIVARDPRHLSGIFFSPFLHGGWLHLMSNTLPFVIFSSLIGLRSINRFWLILGLSIIFTGALVWLFARGGSIHIGMSGVVYAMWGYLIVYGLKQKRIIDILISMIVLMLYGGLVFGVLPSALNISFESHLFGALAGGGLGYVFSKLDR